MMSTKESAQPEVIQGAMDRVYTVKQTRLQAARKLGMSTR
jgi:hypothetical protein